MDSPSVERLLIEREAQRMYTRALEQELINIGSGLAELLTRIQSTLEAIQRANGVITQHDGRVHG